MAPDSRDKPGEGVISLSETTGVAVAAPKPKPPKKLPLAELRVRYAFPELELSGRLVRMPALADTSLARFNNTVPGQYRFNNSGDQQALFYGDALNLAPLVALLAEFADERPRVKLRGVYGATEVQRWLEGVQRLLEWHAKDKQLAKRFSTTLSIRELA